MKKIALALVIAAGFARAEEWLEMPNNAGGKMLFLSNKCGEESSSGRLVISTMQDGTTIRGCWYYFTDMVHVVWVSPPVVAGQTSAFDPKTLAYKKQ